MACSRIERLERYLDRHEFDYFNPNLKNVSFRCSGKKSELFKTHLSDNNTRKKSNIWLRRYGHNRLNAFRAFLNNKVRNLGLTPDEAAWVNAYCEEYERQVIAIALKHRNWYIRMKSD